MSWYCEHCDRKLPDIEPAYGWVCDPHCGPCWEKLTGKTIYEPPYAPVTPKRLERKNP